jgi:hypothetical protein
VHFFNDRFVLTQLETGLVILLIRRTSEVL